MCWRLKRSIEKHKPKPGAFMNGFVFTAYPIEAINNLNNSPSLYTLTSPVPEW